MSSSPRDAHEDAHENPSLDELDEPQPAPVAEGGNAVPDGQPPAKRGRGRPKGSRNKDKKSGTAVSAAAAEGSAVPAVPRKRGRPPKEKKEESGAEEPPQKRKRGRPPKNPKNETEDGGEAGEPPVKRKRGRPPKKVST